MYIIDIQFDNICTEIKNSPMSSSLLLCTEGNFKSVSLTFESEARIDSLSPYELPDIALWSKSWIIISESVLFKSCALTQENVKIGVLKLSIFPNFLIAKYYYLYSTFYTFHFEIRETVNLLVLNHCVQPNHHFY